MKAITHRPRANAATLLLAGTLMLAACADADPGTEGAGGNDEIDGIAAGSTDADQDDEAAPDTDAGSDTAPDPPAPGEPLTQRAEFTDDVGIEIRSDIDGREEETVDLMGDASRFVVAEFIVEPGQKFPWHTHPGPVLINIAEADDDAFVFTFVEDCQERTYSGGEALIDPGGENVTTGGSNVHTARNDGDTDIRVVAVILGADAEDPLTIPIEPDEAAALDEKCDVVTPGHGDGH